MAFRCSKALADNIINVALKKLSALGYTLDVLAMAGLEKCPVFLKALFPPCGGLPVSGVAGSA